jgi:very-short-patch-repair endonuclease
MSSRETVLAKLEAARRELLDLSGRNRLLNTPRRRTRTSRLDVVDELSEEVFRHLVTEGRAMSFLPAVEPPESLPEPTGESTAGDQSEGVATESLITPVTPTKESRIEQAPIETNAVTLEFESSGGEPDFDGDDAPSDGPGLAQPEDDDEPEPEDDGPSPQHVDDRLQTELSSEQLQKRLLKLYYDARTFEEEQGVNLLFLAMGFLKWIDVERDNRERFAPLILVPVQLQRRSARSRFRVRYNEDEIATNLSLQEKLKVDCGITLPDVGDMDDFSPTAYFDAVQQVVAEQDGWEVRHNEMAIWFFSFSKFLMYRDLQPENWPTDVPLDENPLVTTLLTDGFPTQRSLCGDDESIDALLDPLRTIHVADADSSQAIAIEEVRRGANLVIQGPPGTGKSQTITNLIAAAVCDGKRVLFVAEKMAALDVVRRRLGTLGVGDACLELHSHKSSKRVVLRDLDETLRLGQPIARDMEKHATELREVRDRLNAHADAMSTPLEPSGVAPFDAIGELSRLRSEISRAQASGGPQPADTGLVLPGCESWTPDDRRVRVELLTELAAHLETLGVPGEHPWRGVNRETILPTDLDRLLSAIPPLLDGLQRLGVQASELAGQLGTSAPVNAADVVSLLQLTRRILAAPQLDTEALASSVWTERRREIANLIEAGSTLVAARERLSGVVADVGWQVDVAQSRIAIAAHGRSWFRILNGSYRQAMTTLKGILAGPLPRTLEERLAILDALIDGQKALKAIVNDDGGPRIGAAAFGSAWRADDSDWSHLSAIWQWDVDAEQSGLPIDHRAVVPRLAGPDEPVKLCDHLESTLTETTGRVDDLVSALQLDIPVAFDVASATEIPLASLASRLSVWLEQREDLSHWTAFRLRWLKLELVGLGPLAKFVFDGRISSDLLVTHFHLAVYEALTREAFRQYPEFAEFDGTDHEQLIGRFSRLDMDHMLLARREVAVTHFDQLPRRAGNIGEVGVLRREIQKKRQHLPLRRLFAEAGRAVQAVKPVFMMSPTSIAQFLEPGEVEFDLLVFDEASQVPPVDALGAIARSHQIVVVGDSRQLPPTRFFQRAAEDDDTTTADEFQAGHMESILTLCVAQNVPQRMLRWHYRSRHHSLIDVSNREFYNSRLCVIPSPETESEELGLRFRFVEDGEFDRGGSATNRNEARTVVDAVMEHAAKYPTRSLGVGTFSVSQRDAILDELERHRRDNLEFESFFAGDRYEPFFVKNLENIQGDERDVIFISVGYAKDSEGKLTMHFGPLSNEGGERRLNVLITRSRSRCEVFSSIRPDEIDLSRTQAIGTRALKTFLETAAAGVVGRREISHDDEQAPLEEHIADMLTSRGWQVHRRIGVTGLFVDLALVDPDRPGRYLLGIECDGHDYSSAQTARDRDRLRFQVLIRQRWLLHRVWTVDWFQRPEEQLDAIIQEAIAAKQNWSARDAAAAEKSELPEAETTEPPPAIERRDDTPIGGEPLNEPYVEAAFIVTDSPPQDLPVDELASTVRQVIEVEGPVHRDEVTRRVSGLFGLGRVGTRVSESVDAAIEHLSRSGGVELEEEFLSLPDQSVRVRDRSKVESSNLRKPEMLPPSEIRAGLMRIVQTHFAVTRDEAIVETGRLFGSRSTSAQLRDRIDGQITIMLGYGALKQVGERIRC